MFDYCLEMGSSYTVIYKKNVGIILKEISCVLFEVRRGKRFLLETGTNAFSMFDKNNPYHVLNYPIVEGVVEDTEAASLMIKEFFIKIEEKNFLKNHKVLLSVPCGLQPKEQNTYKNILYTLNINKVLLLPSVLMAYVKMSDNISIDTKLVVNLGGGLVNIAIISNANILFGCSINLGGIDLNNNLKNYFLQEKNVFLNQLNLEELKKDVATLLTNDVSFTKLELDQFNSLPEITVSSKELYPIFTHYFDRIAEGILKVLSTCSSEMISQIKQNGMLLCGGLANVTGVDRFFKGRLNLNVYIEEEPELSVILGGGKLIESNLMEKLINKNEL